MTNLKAHIADILAQHRSIAAAAEEIAYLIEEEIDARVQDRVAELRDQLEGTGGR
jgi:hypothetical protein